MSYSGVGGAAGAPTAASEANGTYTYSASYDALLRPTDTKLTLTSNGSTLFEQAPSYDAVGNLTGLATTLPQGTDNQAFCYDELDRLTWASSQSGTGPNSCATNTAGTLTSAQYTQSYSYDQLDRLTTGTTGSYSYGDSAHLHAATAIGPSGSPVWTASYDAAGNMICRAPTNATTCNGGSTGAQLTYDGEGRLSAWQNAPSSPSTTDAYLYDGEGNRVEQQVTTNGVATTITYVGDLEELSTSGGTTITTTYYYSGSQRVAEAVNGSFSYLASDGLGSALVALDGSGNVQSSVLYGPYGTTRYANGTMPGSYGFTGQRADSATGLDYYNARYYDPVAGQFASADPAQASINAYEYVGGNPETFYDPTGQLPKGFREWVLYGASWIGFILGMRGAPSQQEIDGTIAGGTKVGVNEQGSQNTKPGQEGVAGGPPGGAQPARPGTKDVLVNNDGSLTDPSEPSRSAEESSGDAGAASSGGTPSPNTEGGSHEGTADQLTPYEQRLEQLNGTDGSGAYLTPAEQRLLGKNEFDSTGVYLTPAEQRLAQINQANPSTGQAQPAHTTVTCSAFYCVYVTPGGQAKMEPNSPYSNLNDPDQSLETKIEEGAGDTGEALIELLEDAA